MTTIEIINLITGWACAIIGYIIGNIIYYKYIQK